MDPRESSVDDDDEPLNDQSPGGAANDAGDEHRKSKENKEQTTALEVDDNSCELVELGEDLETKMKIKESGPEEFKEFESEVDPVTTTITAANPGGATDTAAGSSFSSTSSSTFSSKPRRNKATAKTQPSDATGDTIELKLPHTFNLKYLGKRDAAGIWGFKYTRKPVDALVAAARQRSPIQPLPFLQLTVSVDGIGVQQVPGSVTKDKDYPKGLIPIHSISYGVQDLVYTRVFAMIVVSETNNVREKHPFQCHAFVSDSRQTARLLTYALAEAFKQFSTTVKAEELRKTQKRFAIDLRQPEEMKSEEDVVDDSEA